ncbi:hypothetical protein D9M72_321890 [compost metagenome]
MPASRMLSTLSTTGNRATLSAAMLPAAARAVCSGSSTCAGALSKSRQRRPGGTSPAAAPRMAARSSIPSTRPPATTG